MANIVSSRPFEIRHHGAVAKTLVGSPIVFVRDATGIIVSMSIGHGHIADERHRVQGVEARIVEQGIIDTRLGLSLRGHLIKSRGSTYTEIVVLIPIALRNGTDIAEGSLVGGTNHRLTEAGLIILSVFEVGGQAAVAHSPEVLAGVRQAVDIRVCEFWIVPFLNVTMGSVVNETYIVNIIVASSLIAATGEKHMRSNAMGFVEIVIVGILDGWLAHLGSPFGVPAGDEQRLVQIAGVRHGVFLVGQNLVHQVAELFDAGHWHTAEEHVMIDVTIN